MPPPGIPTPGITAGFSGFSATTASVVRNSYGTPEILEPGDIRETASSPGFGSA